MLDESGDVCHAHRQAEDDEDTQRVEFSFKCRFKHAAAIISGCISNIYSYLMFYFLPELLLITHR